METLSAIFVSVVTAVSSILPNANLPTVLGEDTVQSETKTIRSSELLEKARLKREETTKRIEQKRLETKEKIASREAQFKEKLSEIKDERKQKIVENLTARLVEVNNKWVTHWNNVLTRLTEILAKIETRGNAQAQAGKDITALSQAIANAKTTMANAQGAIDAQSTKTYNFEIDSEENLGQNVKMTLDQFHSDIRSVWELVKQARRDVVLALRQLGSLTGEKVEIENE